MVRFKRWLEVVETAFPQPMTMLGKQVSSDQEFDDVSRKDWNNRGYDNAQVAQLGKDVDNDVFWNHDFPAGPVWRYYDDPNFRQVNGLINKIMPQHGQRQELFRVVEKDPIAHNLFQKLFHPGVTDQDVQTFIQQMQDIGVFKPAQNINDPTELYRKPIVSPDKTTV